MKAHAKYWIKKLELLPHPEGGYYKEVYRDNGIISQDALVGGFTGDRNFSTAIYYLLEKGDFSCFHRIKSDEIWHLYAGGSAIIYYFLEGQLHTLKLGTDIEKGESPLCIVPKNTWFAAELSPNTDFALMGCTVAPGFDFTDFEKAQLSDLEPFYLKYSNLIKRLIL
ncbi:MAG: hypothetical protein GQ527_09885 [Bacteroidales bacterium]|nr:hypothetical protein [Bacteroidales bacterium]